MYVLLIVVCPFILFLLAIVLSVLLRYTNSDYLPFGIFKLFFLDFVRCEYTCSSLGFSWIRGDRRFTILCWVVLFFRRSVSCVLFY